MTEPKTWAIRDAGPDDLHDIARLRESVGWPANEWALRIAIEAPVSRCFVATLRHGEVVAVGSGIVYGPLGFVGNMIVADAHRRHGLGSAILEAVTGHLEASGCRRLELNATSDGRPLYERYGFSTIGTSATARIRRDHLPPAAADAATRRAGLDELGELAAYDRPRFGGDRGALLEILLRDRETAFVVAAQDGRIVGYGCVRTDTPRIGPFVADDPSIAETLLRTAFATVPAAAELRLNLPPNNRAGAEWLTSRGVEVEPWDGRMERGADLPRRDDTLYGMTVGALG